MEDYRKRIEREVKVVDRRVKVKALDDGVARRRAEGEALWKQLPDPCWVIALDRRGKTSSSEEMASLWKRLREEWSHPVAFLIGSDLGLDPDVLGRARQRLSFGPMTFGHELARLMLYEQIYRMIAIDRGIKYHRQPF